MDNTLGIENKLSLSDAQFIDEALDAPLTSTSIPNIGLEDDGTIWGLIMIVFGALAIIVIMFLIALFIDCRQQKLVEIQQATHQQHLSRKRKLRIKVPRLGRTIEEDLESFSNKMQTSQTDEPPV